MKHSRHLSDFISQLRAKNIAVKSRSETAFAPACLMEVGSQDWLGCAQAAQQSGLRWVAGWGDHEFSAIRIFACLEAAGEYLLLRTQVSTDAASLPSQSPAYPAADRPERHTRDLLGVVFRDATDDRRWLRHQAWDEKTFPLRNGYPLAGQPPAVTPPDNGYPFHRVAGTGVYEIPVGPVHAGIIEPGHFRFNAVGEEVLSLEQHLGYVHKGIEKLACGRSPQALVRLAARVSGDSTVVHSWAACMAMERAVACEVPPRVNELRALLCERERVANHLGDIGAICNDVGFGFANHQCSRLREQWQRRSAGLFGHRLMMDCVVPGGVNCEIDQQARAALLADIRSLQKETEPLFDLLQDLPSLEDRLLRCGLLSTDTAKELGCTGYVGKASGHGFDLRVVRPYPPYDRIAVDATLLEAGDVMARMQVRMQEVRVSLNWMERLLNTLSEDADSVDWPVINSPAQGLGVVDGWRGEVLAYIRFDADGKVARYFPRDPSWHHWPALERIVPDNIVPDFPVCNKSINGSYSGQDL